MMNPKGRWNDVSCNSQAYVICEKCINCPPELLKRSALDEGLSIKDYFLMNLKKEPVLTFFI